MSEEFDAAAEAGEGQTPRRGKSEAAFRTISEVAEDLDVPQHVLRFWESRFTQIRPLKRGGGRRYYRPEDVLLLRRIRDLLYRDGYTIKGVQKLLKDGLGKDGAEAVAAPAAEPAAPPAELPDSAAAAEPEPVEISSLNLSTQLELRAILQDLQDLKQILRRGLR